jgi:hypothetical protein
MLPPEEERYCLPPPLSPNDKYNCPKDDDNNDTMNHNTTASAVVARIDTASPPFSSFSSSSLHFL